MELETIFLFIAESESEPEFISLFLVESLLESIWSFLVESESIISNHPESEPESNLY